AGPPDTSAPCGGNAPKEDAPRDHKVAGDSSGSKCNQPVSQVSPASSGGYPDKDAVPALQRAAGDSAGSTERTVEATVSPKVGDLKSANEPLTEKSGVHSLTSVAAASKRPPPPDQQ
ncbi:hypothetical protein MTO96_006951, partial [Rhipicephalus appendiculatus]